MFFLPRRHKNVHGEHREKVYFLSVLCEKSPCLRGKRSTCSFYHGDTKMCTESTERKCIFSVFSVKNLRVFVVKDQHVLFTTETQKCARRAQRESVFSQCSL